MNLKLALDRKKTMSKLALVITLFISVIAAGISAFSLYYSHLQKANVAIEIGKVTRLWYENALARLDTEIVFANSGIQQGIVRDVTCKIQKMPIQSNNKITVFEELWFSRTEKNEIKQQHEVIVEHFAHSVVVPGKGSALKTVCFGLRRKDSKEDFKYEQGFYKIVVKIYPQDKSIERYFEISTEQTKVLERKRLGLVVPKEPDEVECIILDSVDSIMGHFSN